MNTYEFNIIQVSKLLLLVMVCYTFNSTSSSICKIQVRTYDLLDALNHKRVPVEDVLIKVYSGDADKWYNKGETDGKGRLEFKINFDEAGELLFKFRAQKDGYKKTSKLLFVSGDETVYRIQYLLLENEDKQKLAELIRADIGDGSYEDALDKISIFEDAYPDFQLMGFTEIMLLKEEVESILEYGNPDQEQFASSDFGTKYYVSPMGGGNGSSWQNATNDLQGILQEARAGDQIWVAKGIYKPSTTDDRNASFEIPNGVLVYGGFAGTETSLEERNWQLNETILSGELGSEEDSKDNSYTIVYLEAVNSKTVLDGFFLQGAAANGLADGADLTVAGGAIFNNGKDQLSSPTIANCVFRNNYARIGAGIYNFAENGDCSPQIINCKFINNKAEFKGGAIFNNGEYGVCNPQIIECKFESNWSVYGAGIFNQAYEGKCMPLVTNSVFVDNYSEVRGSSVYNLNEGSGVIEPIFVNSFPDKSNSTVGGDIEETSETILAAKNKKSSIGSIQMRASSDTTKISQ